MSIIIDPIQFKRSERVIDTPGDLLLEADELGDALQSFRFAWISDTHYSPHSQINDYGVDSHVRTERVLEQIAEFNREHSPISAIVHTGDVNDKEYSDTSSYQSYDRLMESLQLPPAFYVAGNHDDPQRMSELLAFGDRVEEYEERGTVCYQFEMAGVPCLVLDGRVDTGARGRIEEGQIEWLEERLERLPRGEKAMIFLHFPLFERTSGWVQDEMLVENGEDVHRRLVPHREKILGVLHGHVHASRQTVRDGILYASAPSASYAFDVDHPGGDWIPSEMVDHDSLTGFTVVDVEVGNGESTIGIRQRPSHRNSSPE